MVELTAYLQNNPGFSYVLPGKFMLDPTEGRFGWYWQVNGGNFFMSLKQLLKAENMKTHVLSLLQQKTLVAVFRTTGLDITFKTATVKKNQVIFCGCQI